MNKELINLLKGEYLLMYEKITLLCKNLTYFIDSDGYFQNEILNESLDMLLECQEHNEPVEKIYGKNLYHFISSRYQDSYDYSFTGSIMLVNLVVIMNFFTIFANENIAGMRMENGYYIFLLAPLIAKGLYMINQTLLIRLFTSMKKDISRIFFQILFVLFLLFVSILMFIVYKFFDDSYFIFLFGIICASFIYKWKKEGKKIIKNFMVRFMFFIEVLGIYFLVTFLSTYIHPLNDKHYYTMFIPIVFITFLSFMPLKGLRKKELIHKQDLNQLFDQYLSHCHFLKNKRKATHDIPLTNQVYFQRIQKRHYLYVMIYPFLVFSQIGCLGLFISGFQLSLFYIIIIGYALYSFYNFYKYYLIKDMISEVCTIGEQLKS